eukprot:TRINITY_DN19344_c0_g1_i1.p1 TRINITY_DN19344_c0_g1~~TRINITY_DN19344_c0_g1_i1.p1  ORF type:complete len:713 (+),score=78.61 TRINITY_DN19344_c0_g1_i1:208-2346(+)
MDFSVVQTIKVHDPLESQRTLRNPPPTFACFDYYEPKRTVFLGQSDGVIVQKTRTHELAPSEKDDFTFRYQWRITSTIVYTGHKGSVTAIRHVPDPFNLLFTGSADRTIKVWDPWVKIKDKERRCLQTLLGHGGTVTGVEYELVALHDETSRLYLMTSSTDGTIRVWTTEEGRELMLQPMLACIQTLTLGSWISSIMYSPNEHLPSDGHLSAVTASGHLFVFSQQRGKEFTLTQHLKRRPHQAGITTVHYSRKDDYWFTLAHDLLVKVYDGQSGSEFFRFTARHGVKFAGVAWNSVARELYVVDEAGWIYVWNTYEEKLLYSAKLRTTPLGKVYLLKSDPNQMIIGNETELIFARVTRQHVWLQYKGHQGAILGIHVQERGGKIDHRLYSGSIDDTVRCWIPLDLAVDRVWSSFEAEMSAFHFIPSMKTFVTGHDDGSVLMWNHDSGTAVIMEGHENAVTCMAISNTRGHEFLITGGYEGWLGVWDIHRVYAGGSILIQMFAAHETEIMSLATHNSKEYIFSGDNEGLIKVWHMEHHDLITELQGHTEPVNSMCLDANFLFSGSDDGSVRMWDVHALSCIGIFKDLHLGHIRGIRLTPQGYLVSVCTEGYVIITDYITEEKLKEFRHDGSLTCVTYRRDSHEILAGSKNGSIVVFPMPDELRGNRAPNPETSRELHKGTVLQRQESRTSIAGSVTLMRQLSSASMLRSVSQL